LITGAVGEHANSDMRLPAKVEVRCARREVRQLDFAGESGTPFGATSRFAVDFRRPYNSDAVNPLCAKLIHIAGS
jgi:hypothetical protein